MEAAARRTRALGLAIILVTVGLVGMAGTAAADDDVVTHQRYVAGTSTPQNLPVQHRTHACTGEVNVGGICDEPVPTETNLVILVDDSVLGRIPFHWQSTNADGEVGDCPGGHSVGETTLNVPPDCAHVDVYTGAPATEGTITIKEDEVVII